jgi:hypothetical protein
VQVTEERGFHKNEDYAEAVRDLPRLDFTVRRTEVAGEVEMAVQLHGNSFRVPAEIARQSALALRERIVAIEEAHQAATKDLFASLAKVNSLAHEHRGLLEVVDEIEVNLGSVPCK